MTTKIVKIPEGCRAEVYIHQHVPGGKSHWRENACIVMDNDGTYGQDAIKIIVRKLK